MIDEERLRAQRAADRQAKKLRGVTLDLAWQKFKRCEVCGSSFCVNNWPDRKSRTPRYQGVVVCPRCDPRQWETATTKNDKIQYPDQYRMVMTLIITRRLSLRPCERETPVDNCKCLPCASRKLLERTEP